MGQVDVTVNGRSYTVGCDDGEEEHIAYLAEFVDKKVAGLVERLGQVGEARLLLMVALMIADDLAGAYDDIEGLQAEIEELRRGSGDSDAALDRLARRIEDIAARLESA
jgi:cell division protein ZapA